MAKNKKKSPDREKIKRISRRVRRILGALILIIVLSLTIFIWSVTRNLPPMGEIENPHLDQSTQIFTADGERIGNFHSSENRIYVEFEDISDNVKKALIATEDVRFRDHSGLDPIMPFAILKDLVLHFDLRGGSSLSQQLARNLYDQVGKDNSITRKIKEAIVAVILESRFTKDEIMTAYLNTAGFYGNTYGIEMGALTLFNKSAKDLDLHEAALMVGLLKGPTYYSPTRNDSLATARRNVVLSQMLKYEKITQTEYDEAVEMGLGLNINRRGTSAAAEAIYFQEEVRKFMKEWIKTQDREYDLYGDGLRVYTTIDSRMQEYAELAVKEHLSSLQEIFDKEMKRYGEPWRKEPDILEDAIAKTDRYRYMKARKASDAEIKKAFREEHDMRIWTWDGWVDSTMTPKDSVIHYLKFLETGFMAMDPKTGAIKAWVGGINHQIFKYDHVKQGKRQVGSTFKPIVYTAALHMGIYEPCDKVLDIPVTIELPDGKRWTPQNSGGGSLGDGAMNYIEGLAQSKNQVTASLMKQAGAAKVCEYAKNVFGIETPLNCVPSLCLGTTDLSVYEMIPAYGMLSNYGHYSIPHFISRIEDKYGHVLAEFHPAPVQRLDSATAYTMVNMMMGVVDHPRGTAHRLRTKYKFDHQIAGKTGTTQNNSDGWFIGYTPNIAAGAWVGNADRRVRFKRTLYGQGANMALPIWAIFMKYVESDKKIGLPTESWKKPGNYKTKLVCPNYGAATGDDGGNDDGKLPEEF